MRGTAFRKSNEFIYTMQQLSAQRISLKVQGFPSSVFDALSAIAALANHADVQYGTGFGLYSKPRVESDQLWFQETLNLFYPRSFLWVYTCATPADSQRPQELSRYRRRARLRAEESIGEARRQYARRSKYSRVFQ